MNGELFDSDSGPIPGQKPPKSKSGGDECFQAIAANTFSMHTITSSKLLVKLKLNYVVGADFLEKWMGG